MTDPWTKGPWYVVRPGHCFRIHTKPDGGYTGALAIVDWWSSDDYGPTKPVAHANAVLFAAAPDLVEALDDLMAEQNGPPLCDPRHEKAWQRAMDNAAAVLVRVRGETKEQL